MSMKPRRWVIAAVACLFLGFWAFAYQGYTEDAGSHPVESWPLGVIFFLAAGIAALLVVKRRWPQLERYQLALVAVGLVGLLAIAAILSLDAGNA